MSNNKQSSVEWLVEQIKKDINLRLRGFDIHKAFEQAKAMHKEEIMNARRNGSYKVTEKYGEIRTNIQYYNDTFLDESNN